MRHTEHVLGVDVGSVAISFVEMGVSGRVHSRGTTAHGGRIRAALAALLPEATLCRVRWIAATSSTPAAVVRSSTVDAQVAAITAAQWLHPNLRTLLIVGGEKFSLSRFDERGEYRDTRTNTSCAAGTGSFLDQQARVLDLGDGADLAVTALKASGKPPKIASRCAVFAKTDLIHAQQEGYSRAEICDGLCEGLAHIVADTLTTGDPVVAPVVFAGGVARNQAVRNHLEARLATRLIVDDHAHFYGALGAALHLISQFDTHAVAQITPRSAADLLVDTEEERGFAHPPLELRLSSYPSFETQRRYEYLSRAVPDALPVEMDVYETVADGTACEVHLGVDVGSTSTKATLVGSGGEVLVGAYTRTAGRPLEATRAIFEALDDWSQRAQVSLRVLSAGTTGSGRKLVGAVIGADLIVDEITAHARAAYELDPQTDTILEIGGQDAKFTTLRHGMVTSAVMNTVCAAGTGSFIEEQAHRLGCALDSYADVVAGARAPLASDRCTVFMQRDINHLLSRGYAVEEILATVLHSVRENYLQKVAREGSIGRHVCFQGATAKNRALVAAFEQRLGQPIRVSRYCHLTGALGVGLLLREAAQAEPAVRTDRGEPSRFRGLELYAEPIPVQNEICDLCKNHCKIVTANVMGEVAAYGFLCGRDYGGEGFVPNNTSGFDLLKTRRKVLRSRPEKPPWRKITIGIPAALYVLDDLDLWRRFFQRLGVRVVTSEALDDPVGVGKTLARAEFCAPMAAWHGHVDHLRERADYVFAPVYLQSRGHERGLERKYCYYSQFASSLAATLGTPGLEDKLLTPLITPGLGDFQTKVRLYTSLRRVLGPSLSLPEVASAYAHAVRWIDSRRARLKTVMRREVEANQDIAVVLLGRPYACLAPKMNKGIPDILGALGVKTFYQDMLTRESASVAPVTDLLEQLHWKYAAQMLEAAAVVAQRPGLYPVLVTSFKCAPDSLTLEFFRRILDAEGKPHLVLELDEHDSEVGYETRIEAAVRSFRNHHLRGALKPARSQRSLPVVPEIAQEVGRRTLFLPGFDRLSCPMLAANLRHEGIDAHVAHEDATIVQKALRRNTGQCIPLNAIVGGFVSEVTARGLDPRDTALWVLHSNIACNIGMYPAFIKAMLEGHGQGFERAAVYCGEISYVDLSVKAAMNTYFAYMFGGMLRRMACHVRPYELRAGEADAAVEAGLQTFVECFERGTSKSRAVREVVDRFTAIQTRRSWRPKVAIFGDMYVRDNHVMSQDLVRFIERHGGEVITTPYSELLKIVGGAYFRRWFYEGRFLSVAVHGSLLRTAQLLERQFVNEFARVLGTACYARPRKSTGDLLAPFALTESHTGESVDNILKLFYILETYPDLSLFVQANPAFCCPSLVTEAMAGRIEQITGVPVVTVTYDGTASAANDVIVPYLEFASKREASQALAYR